MEGYLPSAVAAVVALSLDPTAGSTFTYVDPALPIRRRPAAVLSAAEMFRLVEDLMLTGHTGQAVALLELLGKNPDTTVRSEALFRHAQFLESKGQNQAAAVMLRRVLDTNPSASAVRLRLVSVLQKLGEEDLALRHLRALGSTELPISVARFVDRLTAVLQASKPFGVQVEFAIAPDSNINRASRYDTLGTVFGDFELDQQSKSGVGLTTRALAQARIPASDRLAFAFRTGVDANLYREKEFNEITLDGAAGPEWRSGRTRVSAETGITQQWYGSRPYQRSLRLGGSVTQAIGNAAQVRLDLSRRRTDHRLNHLQDGHGMTVRLRAERALNAQTMLSFSGGIDRYKARDDAYSTRLWNAGITIYRDVGRTTLSAGVEVGRLKADERLTLLPRIREDKFTRFQIGAVLRQWTVAGFAPLAKLSIERNVSTIEAYDFKRTRTEFGVSRAF